MPRTLSAPKNPEFLVGTVAALRLLSGERQPGDPLEQEVLAHLQKLQLKPEVARRIVAAFDAKPQADRQHLLGRFADKSHALESIRSAIAPSEAVVRDHRGDAPSGDAGESSMATARDHRRGASDGSAASGGSTSRTWPGSEIVGPFSEEMSTGAAPSIRYTIRYKGLWCQKETHSYLPGSDEIYVVTSGLAINKGVNTPVGALTHPVNTHDGYYGDVDSEEGRAGPVAAVYSGNPDTLSLAVIVMEHDYGDPDYYRDEVNTFVTAAIAAAAKLYPPAALLALFKDNIVDAINWILDTEDDSLDTEVVTWERDALEALAIQTPGPYLGTKYEMLGFPPRPGPLEYIDTGLYQHFVTKHRGDGSEYVVCFDIERDPPRPPPIIL